MKQEVLTKDEIIENMQDEIDGLQVDKKILQEKLEAANQAIEALMQTPKPAPEPTFYPPAVISPVVHQQVADNVGQEPPGSRCNPLGASLRNLQPAKMITANLYCPAMGARRLSAGTP